MFSSKRLWWAVIVFLFSIQIPEKAHSVTVDPYQFKTIIGKIELEYERITASFNNRQRPSRYEFTQRYTLDAKGYIFHRLLIVYDTGITYSRRSSGSVDSKTIRDAYSYHLSTTFLPKSIIPLTLRAGRSISKNRDTTTYGLRWTGKFQRLPYTKVNIKKTTSDNNGTVRENSDYGLQMKKTLGTSKNTFKYSLSETTSSSEETTSSTSGMDFSNRTQISRNTQFYFGAARGESTSEEAQKTIVEGLSTNISSSPGKEFSQRHGYNYNRNISEDSTNENTSYSGNIGYHFSDKLSSSLNLATSAHSSTSLTTERQTDSLSAGGNLSYAASEKFHLTESISYLSDHSSSADAGQSNLGDSTRLKVTTRASYNTKLRWANLNSGYSIGYLEESRSVDTNSGNAVEQAFSLALNDMDAFGYATVAVSGRYSYSEPLKGDLKKRSSRFNVRAQNKIWEEYISLNGRHSRSASKTWTFPGTSRNDNSTISGKILYFKRVKITFGASRSNSYDVYDERSASTSKRFTIGYGRTLYNGRLTTEIRYKNINRDSGGILQSTSDLVYTAGYGKVLLGLIPWEASLSRTEKTADGSFLVVTKLTNSFAYRLRAWSLGAKHDYTSYEYLNSSSSETRLLLTASRMFGLRRL